MVKQLKARWLGRGAYFRFIKDETRWYVAVSTWQIVLNDEEELLSAPNHRSFMPLPTNTEKHVLLVLHSRHDAQSIF